jgi:hypothetical protein
LFDHVSFHFVFYLWVWICGREWWAGARGVRIATRVVKGCLQSCVPFASPKKDRPKLIGTENVLYVKITGSFTTVLGMSGMVVVIAFIALRVLKHGPCQVAPH